MTEPLSMTPVSPDVFAVLFSPNVSNVALNEQERVVMGQLASWLLDGRYQTELNLSGLYYHGMNTVPSLGISVPPELEQLRAVLSWCQAGVDARSERLNVLGFRLPGETTIDDDLHESWQANNMNAEATLIHDAAMIYGRSYAIVGPGEDGPLITTESPHNMIGSWDVRNRCLSAAYQTYLDVDPASETYLWQLATLYTREATIQLARGPKGWEVQDRNNHNTGVLPVVQFTPHPSIVNRFGNSTITPSWRNTQDRACRSLVSMEVAREFFATMKIFILGASESAFQDADGNIKSAWETYIGRLSALEADSEGALPQIHEVRGESPDGFIRSLDHERQIMAGHTGLPAQYLGILNNGNPTSADAIRMSDFRLKTTADRLASTFGNSWEQVMRLSMLMQDGSVPDEAQRMETDWGYTGIPTPNADAVTVTTQIDSGMVPPTADDALSRVGWSPIQRQRIAEEREKFDAKVAEQQAQEQRQEQSSSPGQASDGEQPKALNNLNNKRSTDAGQGG